MDKDKEAAVIQQVGKQDYDASCHRKLAETRKFIKTTRKQVTLKQFLPEDFVAAAEAAKRSAEQEAERPSKRARLPGVAA